MASRILITLLVSTLCQGLVSSFPRYPSDLHKYMQDESDTYIPFLRSYPSNEANYDAKAPVPPKHSWTLNYYSGKNGIYSRFGQRGSFQSFPAQRFEQPMYQPYHQNGYRYFPRDPARDKLASEFGKLYQLNKLQKKLELIITKQTDTLLVEDLTRILKNSNSRATSTVAPGKLQKLRKALLTFLFSNSTVAPPKQMIKLKWPRTTTSSTPTNVTIASTSGITGNDTVISTENLVAVTNTTSSPQSDLQPERPSRLNLVKLLQIYGTQTKAENSPVASDLPPTTTEVPTTQVTQGDKGVSNFLNLLG